MEEADIVIVYNGVNHFNAAGKGLADPHYSLQCYFERSTCRPTAFLLKLFTISLTIHMVFFSEGWLRSIEVGMGVLRDEGVPLEDHPSIRHRG